jgi:signal transduction histidine kinase
MSDWLGQKEEVMAHWISSTAIPLQKKMSGEGALRFRSSRLWSWVLDVWGTSGFRLAIVFVIVFGVSVSVLGVSVWEQTQHTISAVEKSAITSDALILSARYGDSGLLAASEAVQRLSSPISPHHGLYLLVDHQGNIVAGNLSHWPTGISEPETWYHKTIIHNGAKVDGIFRAYDLPEGFRLLVGRDTDGGRRILKMLRNEFLSMVGEVICLAVIGGAMMRTILSRALADLNDVAGAIRRGDLSARIGRTRRGRDLDRIAETINEILDRTSSLLDGVRNVTSAISHDLRTPITRVRMRLEEATKIAADRPDLQEALSTASTELDRITSIFAALLRIAEIESGSRRSAFRKFDLAPHLASIIELYQTYADETGITLILTNRRSLPMYGDPDMIQQALVNLLDNALKFSPCGGLIDVRAIVDGEFVAVSIADQGPGISESDRHRVGERFFRAETARSTPGSGLGLSLVISVCQLHGGAFLLADNAPGLKATIRLHQGHHHPVQTENQHRNPAHVH